METNQKVTYGLIGILTLFIAALGGNVYLSEDQLAHAYICSVNQNVVIADHLSSTGKTAYWYDEANVSRSKICTNGLWLPLKQYAKDNGLELNILLQNVNKEESAIVAKAGQTYRCDQTKCVLIS
jgi:hypothetical protein